MADSVFEVAAVQTPGIPYPNFVVRKLLRLPIELYRAGLGWLLNRLHIMVLTTEGRVSGLPRYAAIEYRAHGSKIYAVSAWGERPDWYQNLLAHPTVSLSLGDQHFSAHAQTVTDPSEALRVLNVFRKAAPARYDAIMTQLSTKPAVNRLNLPDVSSEFTIVRFDLDGKLLTLPVVMADRLWVWPALLGGLLLAALVVRRIKL